jgi:hypothetical protein
MRTKSRGRRNNPCSASSKPVKSMSRASVRSCLSWTTSKGFESFRPEPIDQDSDGTQYKCLGFSMPTFIIFPYLTLLSWSAPPRFFHPELRHTSCLRYRSHATNQSQRYIMARLRPLSVVSNIRHLAQRHSYISTSALSMLPCPPASVNRSCSGHIPLSLNHQNMGALILPCSPFMSLNCLLQSYMSATEKRKECRRSVDWRSRRSYTQAKFKAR